MNSIASLQASYRGCSSCSGILGKVSIGKGNTNSDLMFVSLSPINDVTQNKLDSILSYMQRHKDDIWITTSVKHTTPNSPRECIENCKSILLEELSIIKPKIVWLSGQDAMYSFFPNKKLSVVRGAVFEAFEYPDYLFFCTHDIASMVLTDVELRKLKARSRIDFEQYNKRYLELTYDINKLTEVLKEV